MRTIIIPVFLAACVTSPELEVSSRPVLDLTAARADTFLRATPRLAGLANAPLDASGLVDDDDGRNALSLVVACALEPGAELDATMATGAVLQFVGELGLAPGWLDHRIGRERAALVTGCALAHVTLEGLPAVVSLRGPGLPAEQDEHAGWPVAEGRFLGDSLGAGPQVMAACRGAGQLADPAAIGLELRRCAVPDPARPGLTLCGLAFAGDCTEVCHGARCELNGRHYPAVASFVER